MFRQVFIVLFFSTCAVSAQVLLPTTETAFEPQHNFNPEVIKTKGIKKITFEITDKKDFEMVVDKNLTENYEFNTDGKLTRFYFTTIAKTNERQVSKVNHKGQKVSYTSNDYVYDTVSTTYFYSGNNLILKRYNDGLGYYESRYYRYDAAGNLTKELRFKETNNSHDKSLFILANQVLLSEDSFQYQKFKSQLKCTFLNTENRPYKERITNYDSLGRKKNENMHYTVASWIMQENKFEYNKDNHLALAQFEGNTGNKILIKNTYEYDEMKELYTEKQYKNDVLLREISYVTSKADSLLNSIVIRDPENKSIRIVKLKYDFGMIGKTGK